MPANVPTYRLYGERPEDASDFWLHCESLPARSRLHDWEIAAHRHEAFFQIFHVTSGQGKVLNGDRWDGFAGPAVLFIPPGAVHGFSFVPEIDGTVVTALGERLRPLAAADRQIAAFVSATRTVPLGEGDGAGIADAIARIATEAALRRGGSNMLLEALITQIMVGLARLTMPVHGGPEAGRDHDRVAQLEMLIEAHFREQPPTGFFAGQIGVSTTHLNRMAHAVAGMSVQDMLANRLLDQARRDLIFTPSSVQAIAYSLGFSDPAYFNRFFRKRTNMTPGQFRMRERARR